MKKYLSILLALCMIFSVCAVSASAEELKPVELIVSITAADNKDGSTGEALHVLKDYVEEASNGLITLDCYWGNALYAQDAETAAVTAGDIFMTFSGSAWLTDGSPWVSMFASGFFFRDLEHMNNVLNGEIGKEVFQKIADEQGILPLGAFYTGERAISLNVDRCVQSREDLADINLRMPSSEAWMFMGEALGSHPTAINYSDLYLALQTGTVDGQDNAISAMIIGSFAEVQKSLTATGHVIDSVWPTVNLAMWNDLPEQYRTWILEGVEATRAWIEESTLKGQKEYEEQVIEKGLSVYHIDTTEFAKSVQDYYLNSDYSNTWDMDLYEKIQGM